MANPFAKTRDVENPYAIYKGYIDGIGEIEIRVLKRYKHSVKSEKLNRYSKWFTAAKSPMTFDSWEYSDQYVHGNEWNGGHGISDYELVGGDPKWIEQYASNSEFRNLVTI
jgi:hypothetical protein